MREKQIEEIAEWVDEHVDREDFDELVEKLPDELRAAHIRRNILKQQPFSGWQHFRNWWKFYMSNWDFLFIFFAIVWIAPIAIVAGGCYSIGSVAEALESMDVPVTLLVIGLDTFLFQILPWTITLIRWGHWYAEHPISSHDYWLVEDYLD